MCVRYQEVSYYCECQPYYIGVNCEQFVGTTKTTTNTVINYVSCDQSPCSNGGTCTQLGIGSFICVCQVGFTGSLCQIDINECLSNPCLNGATCIDRISRFACLCPVGYTGSLCQEMINFCNMMPCLNGGTCAGRIGGFVCTCPVGITGARCEISQTTTNTSPR